jgi:hypothetical protein
MYSWSFIKTNKNINFTRSVETQYNYDKNKIRVLKKFNTYEDYIKVVLFKLKYIINIQNKIESNDNKCDKILFLRNKYPYNIEKGIKHYVLFSLKPLNKNEIINILSKLLVNYEFIFFINDKKKQSIKNLWHCQVFIKIDSLKK